MLGANCYTIRISQVNISLHPKLGLLDRQDIAYDPRVRRVLEHPRIVSFFRNLFDCEHVATTRYKWLRAVKTGKYTGVHIDRVYLGGGSARLTTMWIPFGDVSMRQGTLLVSVGSHRTVSRLRKKDATVKGYEESAEDQKNAEQQKNGEDQKCAENLPKRLKFSQEGKAALYVRGGGGKQGDKTSSGWIATEPGLLPTVLQEGNRGWVSANFSAGDVAVVPLDTIHMSTTNSTQHWRISCDTRWQPAEETMDPVLKFQVLHE